MVLYRWCIRGGRGGEKVSDSPPYSDEGSALSAISLWTDS